MSAHSFHRLARTADGLSRRAFAGSLARGLLGLSAASLGGGLRHLAAAAPALSGLRRPARQVIYLFLRGGMSHLDTLDPKPGAATQGATTAIRTRADGVLLGHRFARLAEQMDKVCVVRSMTSKQGAHQQAQYLMRTSYDKRGTIQHPSLGAFAQRLGGRQNATLPAHVVIGGGADMPGAGFLPPQFAPLPIGSAQSGLQNAALPPGVDEERFRQRLARLRAMDEAFAAAHPDRAVQGYGEMYAEAVRLMRSSDLAAFDIAAEPAHLRAAYGADGAFGAGCLLARRLVEHGVRFVEVVSDGWDTHADNFERLDDLVPAVDQGLAALLADLDGRGLLRETLVVLATEFGRTPDIDQDQGRNHHPRAFSCLLAGGAIQGGRSFGQTCAEGREVVEGAVTIQDFNATIAHALDLPLDQEVLAPSGRPFRVADKGEPVLELFG